MKIDMFSHILPEPYLKKRHAIAPDARDMDARAATVCGIEFFGIDHTVFGTDARIDMFMYVDLQQVAST